MAKFILFLDRLITLYLYYLVGACLLSWVPNINYNYPLFHYIFKFAGFYLLPPVMGFIFAPAIIMTLCVLLSMGLEKIYQKYYASKEPKVIILTPDELAKKLKQTKEKQEEDNNGSTEDNRSDS